MEEIKNKIEAILFLGGEEIKIKELCKFFSISYENILKILYEFKGEKKHSGINIEISDETVYLVSNPKYGEVISNFFEQEKRPRKLSSSALETLSIIAYNQPITKSEIELIRGVNVDNIVYNMEGKNFIKVCGKKETIGRPNLYKITDKFLGYLGIDSVDELPNYYEIKEKLNGKNKNK